MKKCSQLFVLALSILIPFTQTQMASASLDSSVKAAVSTMSSEVASAKSKEAFAATAQKFLKNIENASDKSKAIAELKSTLTFEAQRKVDALLADIDTGVLTNAEVQAKVTEIAKSSQSTGAAWEGGTLLIAGGIILVVLGVVALSGGSVYVGTTYYCDPYDYYSSCYVPTCYYDYYYGTVCY